MPELSPQERADLTAALEAVRQEFDDGLPVRLQTLEATLDVLSEGFDPEAAETFYHQSHSLKGTAGSFGALELVEPATSLSEIGRSWFKTGVAKPSELSRAREELELLRLAVAAYLDR